MNNRVKRDSAPFAVKDCALSAIATGQWAQNLRELRDNLRTCHPGCIYYHFWGGRLRPRFTDPEYHNDFAIWSRYALQDPVLAERLGIINPNDFSNLEYLRQEIIETIEERLDEAGWVPWAKADKQFYFVRSQIIVFDTNLRLEKPEELVEAVPDMSVGSVFYHFIDALRRSPENLDDFQAWLSRSFVGYEDVCQVLAKVDPFFSTLVELRQELTHIFKIHLGRR
ncbi:MAG: DUF5752 family protein [Thermodesulfobacteriota bacterium]